MDDLYSNNQVQRLACCVEQVLYTGTGTGKKLDELNVCQLLMMDRGGSASSMKLVRRLADWLTETGRDMVVPCSGLACHFEVGQEVSGLWQLHSCRPSPLLTMLYYHH